MKTDLEYIQENYIELNDLCTLCEMTKAELNQLIEKKLIPESSYKINSTHKISSPLGDEIEVSEIKKFFPKSTISLIQNNRKEEDTEEFKQIFKSEFIASFKKHKSNEFAYGGIIDNAGNVSQVKLEEAFEQEWQYYLQGIYGICTLNSTPEEIAHKEITVKRLINFIENNGNKELTEELKKELKILNDDFNAVSNLFAPYQRKASSRGKYLDEMLDINSLSHLKKKYE